MSRYIQEISFYQFLIPEYRCLAHPNAQIDNAMFWKNEHGALECGLLDAWQVCFCPEPERMIQSFQPATSIQTVGSFMLGSKILFCTSDQD